MHSIYQHCFKLKYLKYSLVIRKTYLILPGVEIYILHISNEDKIIVTLEPHLRWWLFFCQHTRWKSHMIRIVMMIMPVINNETVKMDTVLTLMISLPLLAAITFRAIWELAVNPREDRQWFSDGECQDKMALYGSALEVDCLDSHLLLFIFFLKNRVVGNCHCCFLGC